MRQKHYWEIRIRELGGSDYKNAKRQFLDVDGKELPGAPNYKYYGAAKDLPGVRELFAELEDAAAKKRIQRCVVLAVDVAKTLIYFHADLEVTYIRTLRPTTTDTEMTMTAS
jgi:hypothetical protein